MELDESQERAVEMAATARICVITGGPGTGKSTALRFLLDRLDGRPAPTSWPCGACEGKKRDEWGGECLTCDGRGHETAARYVLAAPTGKAAKRMHEATGREAKTVHRLLEYGKNGFGRRPGNPIAAELVIVDEASMLDIELAAALVDAIDMTRTRLVLVGDVAQLPPVGPGRPFADLISSKRVSVARLEHLHRAAAESWICMSAPLVLQGVRPDLRKRRDFRWVSAPSSGHVVPAVLREAQAIAATKSEVQVLAPQRTGAAGVVALNAALQATLNPSGVRAGKSWGRPDERIHLGDRVIQTKNDYPLGVMNGEVGVVVEVRDAELVVDVGDRRVTYTREQGLALQLAYALTVHRAQGSEWPWVVVVAHSTHTMMLTRSLFYTAITRAREGVVIVGDEVGLSRAIANARDDARNSSLVSRLGESGAS